jgi:hypothetical protein
VGPSVGPVEDRRIDARARTAAVFDVLSLSVVFSPGLGLFLAAFGAVFATSCLLDDGVGRRACCLALAALLVSLAAIVAAIVVLYRRPVGGE